MPDLRVLTCLLLVATCAPILVAERLDRIVKDQVRFRHRLECTINPLGAELGYDLRTHHRVIATTDLEPLRLGRYVRIRSYARALKDDKGRRFLQSMPIMESQQLIATDEIISWFRRFRFRGSYPTGPGEYEFVLAVDNGLGRGCVKRWTSVARTPRKQPRGGIQLAPGEIGNRAMEMDAPQREVQKRPDGIRACVLLNVENRHRDQVLTDWDSAELAIASIRLVAEDPVVRDIAIVAFSLAQQEEFYRQGFHPTVDFKGLTQAYERMELGRVAFSKLGIAKELEYLRNNVGEHRECLDQSELVLVISPWWRDSFPHQDDVLRLLAPRSGQTFGYVRPGRFFPRSRKERTFNSWSLVDGLRGAIAKAGGRIVSVDSPFGMVGDIQALVQDALRSRDESSRRQN